MLDRKVIREMSLSITRMSLPILVEQFFIVLMGVVSTMLVGNLGRNAVSAVGNIDVINNVMISIFAALSIGGTVVVAQYTGRDDTKSASIASAQAVMASVILSVFVTVLIYLNQHGLVELLYGKAEPEVIQNSLDYLRIVVWSYPPLALATTMFGLLRGHGNMRAPMAITIIMNLANIAISSVLIYGFAMQFGPVNIKIDGQGVVGAATGLTLARLLGFVMVLIIMSRSELAFSFKPQHFWRVEKDMLNRILTLGVPAGFEQLMFNGGKLIVQLFIVQLGTVALAANAISNSLASMATMPTVAMSTALTTIIGQAIGRKDKASAKRILSFSIPFYSASLLVMSAVILPFIRPVVGLFTQDPETVHETVKIMTFYLIAQPLLWPPSFAFPAGFRGTGDVRYQLYVTMGSMWILRVGLGAVLTMVFKLGVIGVWIAMITDWTMRAILFSLRMKSGKWLARDVI
ncbi:MAG: MATE family efflux transporter [Eubacteriales bacterium]|nr:MATE family efflux transporter [Eubacteriales bacterium]